MRMLIVTLTVSRLPARWLAGFALGEASAELYPAITQTLGLSRQ